MDSGSKNGPSCDVNRIASVQSAKLFAGLGNLNVCIPKAAKLAYVNQSVPTLPSFNQSVTPGVKPLRAELDPFSCRIP